MAFRYSKNKKVGSCRSLLLAYRSSSCIQTIQTASMIPLNFLQHKNIGETEISPIFFISKRKHKQNHSDRNHKRGDRIYDQKSQGSKFHRFIRSNENIHARERKADQGNEKQRHRRGEIEQKHSHDPRKKGGPRGCLIGYIRQYLIQNIHFHAHRTQNDQQYRQHAKQNHGPYVFLHSVTPSQSKNTKEYKCASCILIFRRTC